ncbi:hypothetical protein BDN72DRAFT_962945 [Pluteus cervinus]|uniref:Uncharacterized protein n=1 Tax=Pluteus cervinus TaxID=181527 RepID=A0ACD3AG06_9AGAR|nr:hypothetical protein BDN72DRAFT_962945 [Pluteus cervinus]
MHNDKLPLELWREITEISASFSLHQAATLALVSRTSFDWVQPFLYRTVVYYDEGKGWPLKVASLEWFQVKGCHLRNLMWGELGREHLQLLVSILELCAAIENLAVWGNIQGTDISVLRPALSKLRLRELSINPFALFVTKQFRETEAQDPIFRHITHFHVINAQRQLLDWEDLMGLMHLPHVAYVGLPSQVNPNAIDGILQHCKHVEVLVVMQRIRMRVWDHDQEPDAPSGGIPSDPRVLYIPLLIVDEWKKSALGAKSIWQKSEEVIAKRKRQGSWLVYN